MNASEQITNRIHELNDWRGQTLERLRKLILDADPDIVEDWKWDTPVWSANGKTMVACGAFKDAVKVNFFKGASLSDPDKLFNAGLDAKASRAIDIHESETIDEAAMKALVRAAVALSRSGAKPSPKGQA